MRHPARAEAGAGTDQEFLDTLTGDPSAVDDYLTQHRRTATPGFCWGEHESRPPGPPTSTGDPS